MNILSHIEKKNSDAQLLIKSIVNNLHNKKELKKIDQNILSGIFDKYLS